MRTRTGFLMALALFCAGCVNVASPSGGVRAPGLVPQDPRAVVIRPTLLKPDAVRNAEGLTEAPQLFARSLRVALQKKRPTWESALIEGEGAVSEGGIAITTELVKIDGGNAALRFWIGLGAGTAESAVNVSVLDSTGRELATAQLSNRTTCPVGWCTESNEATVRRNLESLAEEAAEFIIDPAEYQKKTQSKQ
jgi:Domain of unknown function (DUF4410)